MNVFFFNKISLVCVKLKKENPKYLRWHEGEEMRFSFFDPAFKNSRSFYCLFIKSPYKL